MEGAVASGERAAREVLSRENLRPQTTDFGADDLAQRELAQGYTYRG
jgi:hypothetical protein